MPLTISRPMRRAARECRRPRNLIALGFFANLRRGKIDGTVLVAQALPPVLFDLLLLSSISTNEFRV